MRVLLAVALTALAALLLPFTASARPPIPWIQCGTTYKGECATIDAPVDWANPAGPKFKLAIGRVRALDPANRIGVLFIHPGGPGSSGIDRFIIGRTIPDDSALRKYFDIVSVDPRGVGRSNPVKCSADLVAQTPGTAPSSDAEYRSLLAFNARLAADCRAQTGPLFDHVDTTSATRDVDLIRSALDVSTISFYGASYGTQVGQQYAELFPRKIRAMALDSNMDHSIQSAYEYLRTTTDDLEQSFSAFAGWCDRTASCALHGQDVKALWDRLFADAQRGELIDPTTGDPITAESLRFEVFIAMYTTNGWPNLATRLAALAGQQRAPVASRRTAQDTVDNPYPAIWCSDWRWRVSGVSEFNGYLQRLRLQYPHMQLSPFWSDVTTCLGWTGPLNNPQHRLNIVGTPPILLVKSREDVGTPKAWNYEAARQIPNSVLLEYDGIGHAQFRNSPCARAAIEKYLTTLVTPAPGTHCPAVFPASARSALAPPDFSAPPTRPLH